MTRMQPSCCIVNLSSQPADWIPVQILGDQELSQQPSPITNGRQQPEDSSEGPVIHSWRVSTKYFNADILLQVVACPALLEDSERLQPVIQTTEAVVFYCDSTKDSFQLASRAWERFKEVSPAICLCVVERTLDVATDDTEISRAAVMDWCLARQFELVDCEEEEEEDRDHEEDIPEKVGRHRIAEALKSHTWSNMTLLEKTPQGGPLHEEISEEKLPDAEDNCTAHVEKETETFESLFCQLSVMKEESARLPPPERKLYAEKMALAFYAAMGGDDDTDDE